jgi:8-oxo-dGTP pyrophosphatase MutT (NUDIX family)
MRLKEYEQSLSYPLRQATVTLLLRGDEVLLAMKKRGFGAGKWNGVGGKQNPGEDIVDTAVREAEEEIGVKPLNLEKVAIFNYLFPENEGWGQRVHIFTATEWEGEPAEREEMKPEWFKIKDIPYKEMWVDDEIWMPKVFAGKLIRGSFMFGAGERIDEYYLDEVKLFDGNS